MWVPAICTVNTCRPGCSVHRGTCARLAVATGTPSTNHTSSLDGSDVSARKPMLCNSAATPGMRMMGIRLARLDGRPVDFMLAVVPGVLFWALNAVLTPFILLATLVLDRKQTVHDWMLGTVVVRS